MVAGAELVNQLQLIRHRRRHSFDETIHVVRQLIGTCFLELSRNRTPAGYDRRASSLQGLTTSNEATQGEVAPLVYRSRVAARNRRRLELVVVE